MGEEQNFAVITDIHGNRPALEAVLSEIDSAGIKKIYCLGDIVGLRSIHSEDCVEMLMERNADCVLGHTDYYALQRRKIHSGTASDLICTLSEDTFRFLDSMLLASSFGFENMIFSHSILPIEETIFLGYHFRQLEYTVPLGRRQEQREKSLAESMAGLMSAFAKAIKAKKVKKELNTHDIYVDRARDSMDFLRSIAKNEGQPYIISWVGHTPRTWTAIDVDEKKLEKARHFNYREGSFSLDEPDIAGKNIIANPGDVGMNTLGRKIAHYALYLSSEKRIEMRQVKY